MRRRDLIRIKELKKEKERKSHNVVENGRKFKSEKERERERES